MSKRIKVILEKPLTWLESERDGDRHQQMYSNLLDALRFIAVEVTEEPIRYGSDFAPRQAPPGQIRLSYHSVGNARNVWRIKETSVPPYYSFDRLGYSGWSELSRRPDLHLGRIQAESWEDAEAFRSQLAGRLMDGNVSKYRQAPLGAKLPPSFVFFPLQVLADPVAQFNRMNPLMVLLRAAWLAKATGRILVIKRHPYCQSKKVGFLLRALRLITSRVVLTDASVTELLQRCDFLLVGNSGVGLEALVYGRPVCSFADSEYEIATTRLFTAADLRRVFAEKQDPPGKLDARFVAYYFKTCCFDATDVADIVRKLERAVATYHEGDWG